MLEKPFVSYLSESIVKNWEIDALADYKGESFTYAEVGNYILQFHKFFDKLGVKQGDKIALLGKNSARWGIIYLAVVTYGAAVVPVLPDFKEDDLKKIINHSDSILLFADDQLIIKMDCPEISAISGIVRISDFSLQKCTADLLSESYQSSGLSKSWDKLPYGPAEFHLPEVHNDKLAVLSYTSGTTGFTKGVMLLHNSLAANIRYAQNNMPLKSGDSIVSFLPLAHTFGCAFEFLFPFTLGCHVTILTKTPSPQVIMKAFQEIKPALILSVPLVIEKIYKNKLLPVIGKSHFKVLLRIPGISHLILSKLNKKLTETFGANFHEIVMGGAPLSQEAEHFFRRMKFRYTIGYGMTECGPLISYHGWEGLPEGSSGKVVDTLEIKVDNQDPGSLTGEFCVRGDNVMAGYYKKDEDTRKVLDEEGWLHTGDLGTIDEDGFIFIKGRSKSMILGANGKNIYPEEIESMLNNRYGIAESLVVQRDGKLVALVFPDSEALKRAKTSEDARIKMLNNHLKVLNQKLPKFMNVSSIELHPKEFVKTPKKNIKRYLYK